MDDSKNNVVISYETTPVKYESVPVFLYKLLVHFDPVVTLPNSTVKVQFSSKVEKIEETNREDPHLTMEYTRKCIRDLLHYFKEDATVGYYTKLNSFCLGFGDPRLVLQKIYELSVLANIEPDETFFEGVKRMIIFNIQQNSFVTIIYHSGQEEQVPLFIYGLLNFMNPVTVTPYPERLKIAFRELVNEVKEATVRDDTMSSEKTIECLDFLLSGFYTDDEDMVKFYKKLARFCMLPMFPNPHDILRLVLRLFEPLNMEPDPEFFDLTARRIEELNIAQINSQ
jgi:hypothetical protein